MADLTASAPHSLRRDAIGLREVFFQSITDMAPGAAIAASIPFGASFAGGSLPLAVVFAFFSFRGGVRNGRRTPMRSTNTERE